MPPETLMAVDGLQRLRQQQSTAWHAGNRLTVEVLTAELAPSLPDNAVLELIGAEVQLRSERHETCQVDEYVERFPRLRDALRTLFANRSVSPPIKGAMASTIRDANDTLISAEPLARVTSEYTSPMREATGARGSTSQDPTAVVESWSPAPASTASGGRQFSDRVLQPDECFGRFRILRQLGRGGMGIVYLAHDPHLDRHVALKIPKLGDELDETVLPRFRREAQAAGKLRHPHICPVYDVGEIDGTYYLALAYIEGQTLSEVLRDGPLPATRAAEIIRQVALALEVAHAAGIVHRDLKPANIMLDPQGQPVVMDFGLARRERVGETPLTIAGDIMGTPAYMPPEQARGEIVGPAGDVYSLGATLYHLLTGSAPFSGAHLSAVLTSVLLNRPRQPRELRADLPQELCDICLKTLEKRPEDRFASAGELAAALANWEQSCTTSATLSVRQTQAPQPAQVSTVAATAPEASPRASYRRVSAIALGCLLLAGCSAFVLWRSRSPVAIGSLPPQTQTAKPDTPRALATASAPAVGPTAAAAGADAATADMELELILQPAERKTGWKTLDSSGVPLHQGDKVQVHVRLPAPAYVYLYWLDGKGRTKRYWPQSLKNQQPVAELYDPPMASDTAQQRWYQLGGKVPASELLIAGISPTPLGARMLEPIESLVIGLGTPPADDRSSTIWLPPPAPSELRILRPTTNERAIATREPVDIVVSDKGSRIEPLKIEDLLRVFTDYRALLAPRS